ncbi:MAG: peptidylprolyl isomerase, partial [Myxococcota bacterium]
MVPRLTSGLVGLLFIGCEGSPPPPAVEDPPPPAPSSTTPADFGVKFETTKGNVTMACHRAWAPHGADRVYELVQTGFFSEIAFFRAVQNFVVQFGIHGDPQVSAKWRARDKQLSPDRIRPDVPNRRGTVTFAQAGGPKEPGLTAASRSTQLFINLKDNRRALDPMGFAP